MGSAGVTCLQMTRVSPSEASRKAKSICCALFLLALVLLPDKVGAQKFFKHAAKAKRSLLQPEVRIPVAALGYMTPGELPEFDDAALVGVYFIDANRLLFTFDTKGLLHRDDRCSTPDSQRIERAVVLDIPSGKVEKQADWELYDFADYLWNLGGGKFLVRRCSELYFTDSSLILHPFIQPSSAIETIGFSPDRSMLVLEQVAPGPATLPRTEFPFEHAPEHKVNVDFIRLHPPGMVGRSQIPAAVAIPIVDEGILEPLTAPHNRWTIDLQPFHGATRNILTLPSACPPRLTALTDEVIAAGTCSGSDDRSFQGFDMSGKLLWQIPVASDRHELRFLLTRNGAHFAIESLHATRPLAVLDPLDSKVIDANMLDIYDTLTGTRIGGLRMTPVYTAGKNADFSPDGTRIAVLRDGAIEIYSLNELTKSLR